MNSSAVFMMILSVVLLWGGLLAAIIHLSHHPDE